MSRFYPRPSSTSKPTSRALAIAAAASGREPDPIEFRSALECDLGKLDQRAAAGERLDDADIRKGRHMISQLDNLDKAASTPTKAAAASPALSSQSATPAKATPTPSAPAAPRQPRLSAQERQQIIADVQAEMAAEKAAAIKASWRRAHAAARSSARHPDPHNWQRAHARARASMPRTQKGQPA